VLGLCVYCLLISLAESRQKVNPVDQHHQMGEELIEVEYGDLLLDQCPDCHGIWFDRGEMEYLLESLDLAGTGISISSLLQQPHIDADEDHRQCPVCRSSMRKAIIVDNPQLMVDVCPHGDGLWFDGGECGVLIEELCMTGAGRQIAGLSLVLPK
jgi:Zn-finger nucleic acid-binding protein